MCVCVDLLQGIDLCDCEGWLGKSEFIGPGNRQTKFGALAEAVGHTWNSFFYRETAALLLRSFS